MKTFSGKTIRDYGHPDKNCKIDIIKSNKKYLSPFDIEFDMYNHKGDYFSKNAYESAITFFEEQCVYKKIERYEIIYHLPVIGLLEKYDYKKNKYIFWTEDEEEIPYSILDLVVIYKVYNKMNQNVDASRQVHRHSRFYTDKTYRRDKFGNKHLSRKISIDI